MNKNIKKVLCGVLICGSLIFGISTKSNAMSYMTVNSNVNIRQYAGTYSKKLGVVYKGSKIPIYGSYGNWYSTCVNGNWGYVCKDYVGNNSRTDNKGNTQQGQVLNKLIIVNSYYNKIYLYEKGILRWSRPCATGKPRTPTPVGSYYIYNKVDNSNNVLGKCYGSCWMGTSKARYGLHGTDQPSSIGLHASNGCVRMYNTDAKYLYSKVSVGTRIIISAKPVINKTIAAWYGYKVY